MCMLAPVQFCLWSCQVNFRTTHNQYTFLSLLLPSSPLSIPGHHTLPGPAEIHGAPGRVSCIWLHVLWSRVCKQRSKISQRPLAGSQREGGANLSARGCSSHTDLLLQDVRWSPDIVLRIKWKELNLYDKKITFSSLFYPFLSSCFILFSSYFHSLPLLPLPSFLPLLCIALWALVLPYPMNTDWSWRDSYPSPSKLAR